MSDQASLVIPETLLVQFPDGHIEEMEMEEYLKGVVPTEMGLEKPIEALKAQAIASRSYVANTRRHARDGFDICTTPHCQVYKPENRYEDSDRAVDETAGLVLTYKGGIAGAPYFAHCDGHTRNSEDVWPGKVAFCRSVPCICGYDKLWGHGVGMCQRGAAAMARQGSIAPDILTHYYTGVEIQLATAIPRTSFRRSIILGQVVDGQGKPRGGLRLLLYGLEEPINKGTTGDGRFWFTKLPAGTWELAVKDKPVRYGNLVTDGRNTLEQRVVVPEFENLQVRTMPLGYPNDLVGTLGFEGVPVTIVDPSGNKEILLSGSAPDFNPGGFLAGLHEAGTYTVRVLDHTFELEVGDGGVWVQFITQAV
jgi:hypothetical protein